MPYVLKQQQTGEIAALIQKNVYDFEYYGVKWWEGETEAENEKSDLIGHIGLTDPQSWLVVEIPEDKVKLMNVKLKNDPAFRLFMDAEGRLQAVKTD